MVWAANALSFRLHKFPSIRPIMFPDQPASHVHVNWCVKNYRLFPGCQSPVSLNWFWSFDGRAGSFSAAAYQKIKLASQLTAQDHTWTVHSERPFFGFPLLIWCEFRGISQCHQRQVCRHMCKYRCISAEARNSLDNWIVSNQFHVEFRTGIIWKCWLTNTSRDFRFAVRAISIMTQIRQILRIVN